MEGSDSPEVLASDREREHTVGSLQEACVEGRLTLEECSNRVEQALVARTRGQLEGLVRDLPAAPIIPMSPREHVSSTVAILGSVERTGRWRLGDRLRVNTILGSCKLDLRNATISSRVSTIEVNVRLGSLEVVVPEGVEVDVEVGNIMGSRTVRLTGRPAAPGAPTIRIVGTVRAGSVTIRDQPTLGERVQQRIRGMLEQ